MLKCFQSSESIYKDTFSKFIQIKPVKLTVESRLWKPFDFKPFKDLSDALLPNGVTD